MEGPPLLAESPARLHSIAGVVPTIALSSTSPVPLIQNDVRSDWPGTVARHAPCDVAFAHHFIALYRIMAAPACLALLHVGCPLSPSRVVLCCAVLCRCAASSPASPSSSYRYAFSCDIVLTTNTSSQTHCTAHPSIILQATTPAAQMRALAGWILRRHTTLAWLHLSASSRLSGSMPNPARCLTSRSSIGWRRSVMNVTRRLSHTPRHSFIQ